MKCSNCGADMHAGDTFCTKCGSPIQTPRQTTPAPRPLQPFPASEPAPPQPQPTPAAPKKKSRAALWIALGALLVTAGIAVALILGGSHRRFAAAAPYSSNPADILRRAYEDVMPGYSSKESETLYIAGDEAFASVHDRIEPEGETITKLVRTPDGYVAETEFSGSQGMITMVIGLDNDLKCTGIYVTKHSELFLQFIDLCTVLCLPRNEPGAFGSVIDGVIQEVAIFSLQVLVRKFGLADERLVLGIVVVEDGVDGDFPHGVEFCILAGIVCAGLILSILGIGGSSPTKEVEASPLDCGSVGNLHRLALLESLFFNCACATIGIVGNLEGCHSRVVRI